MKDTRYKILDTKGWKLLWQQKGAFLPAAIMLSFVFMIIALSIADYSLANYSNTVRTITASNALFTAEAGAEKALLELNQDVDYTPPAGEVELYNSDVKGRATYQTTIVNGSVANEKIITTTGRIYQPASSSTPKLTRKVRVTVIASDSDFNYAIQTGHGILVMTNSSVVSNGQIRVNGYIDMSNSSRIGSAANPLELWVADISCPLTGGSTYPVLCDSGHTSIKINGPTAHIYATVHKKNAVDSGSITGTIDEIGADPVDMPATNREEITADIEGGGSTTTASAASCDGSQTRTWGNLHITGGNVTVRNNCVVTISGDVWIDGGLTVEQNGELRVGNGLSSAPTLLVDGSAGFNLNNSSKLLASASNIAAKVITFYCGSGCDPDSTPTGDTLFNSRNIVTASINNSAGAAGSVIYARWSRARLQNGTAVGALVGQSVALENTASISFGVALGSGSGEVFTVKFYQEVFD